MENLIFGILTVLICTIAYSFAFKLQRKEKYDLGIILLMLCGLLLRFYTASDLFLHAWDERYHALVAKNLMRHPLLPTLYDDPILAYDYKSWISNHVWLHKQPFSLWTIAGSMQIFGVNEIALRLPSIILTTIGIWLTYSIGRFFFNTRIAFLAAFFYSISGLITEMAAGRDAVDHVDVFFLFFIQLAIFFSIQFIRKEKTIFNILTGITIGLAILSKWLPALIVLPIWLLIVYDSGKYSFRSLLFQFAIVLAYSIIVFLPWQIYIHHTFPLEASWEAAFNFRHLSEVIEGRTGPFYFFLDKMRINYGELIYLPFIWFIWLSFRNIKNYKRLALSVWILVPLIFFSSVQTKMQNYILFIAPALFLITAGFYYEVLKYRAEHKYKWIFSLILILLIALPVRYTIERTKAFENRDRNTQWAQDLRDLNDKMIGKAVIFNYDRPIEAMFYTDMIAYNSLPEKNVVDNIIEKGYTVIINNKDKIPEDILSVPGVIIIDISE